MNYQRKQIEEFPGYEVDTLGQVWSCWERKGRPSRKGVDYVMSNVWFQRSLFKTAQGYLTLGLKGTYFRAHRLVAEAFLSNPENKPYVCHKDGNPLNNNVENLYWGTAKENSADTLRHGRAGRGGTKGEKHPMSKLTKFQVQRIRLMKEISPNLEQKNIAKMFKVNDSCVSKILHGDAWSHIN